MRSVIKYQGAKWSYADWIISFFPKHKVYVELFFGSGAVFFKKTPSYRETINDLDDLVINFFRVCRENPEELKRLIYLTPFSRKEYESILEKKAGESFELSDDNIENARRFAVRCSQSFGGKLADRVGWKNSKSSNGPNNPTIWKEMAEEVICVAERLKKTQVECRPALELIEKYNSEDTLLYADPPYLGDLRNSRIYRKEMMKIEEHKELLNALNKHKGFVVLSGYDNDVYNKMLDGWHKEFKVGFDSMSKPRKEVLWMNFQPSKQLSLEF